MSDTLADALLTIGERPLCTVTVEQGDDDELAFFFENDQTGDHSYEADLAATLASYDQAGPYRLTIFTPLVYDDCEPEGWQSPTINERNSLALACA